MKRKLWTFIVVILVVAITIGIILLLPKEEKKEKVDDGNLRIVTSFYPLYIMTLNITQGVQNVDVSNLTQNDVGCLHDYTLSTADMKKMENADIFIENGLGLEGFMDKIIETYSNIKIIDSSQEVMNKIEEDGSINAHIWTSIDNYIKQVEVISQKLCEYDPINTETYLANTTKYIKSLQDLKLQYNTGLQHLNSAKAICLNEALVYLARDIQMDITVIHTNHEESTLSADTIKNTIQKMQNENIQIILIGTGDNRQNAETLAKETGAKIYELETSLTGNISKDSYINNMTGNLEILKRIEIK